YSQTGVSLSGNLLGAVVMAMIFWPVAPRPELVSWCLLFAWIWVLRLITLRRYSHAGWAAVSRDAQRWQRRWNAGAMASGACWGLAAWLFYNDGRAFHQTTLLLIIYSFCVGSIPLMATQHRIFFTFISLCFVPTIVRIATLGSNDALQLAGVMS
ncbi:hypothetical protein, partial [Salmonella enterica]|uniref:hypothetical protein n=1 Tax=Salmonella enterica TaxID=28901 RepID=UPI003FA6AD0C